MVRVSSLAAAAAAFLLAHPHAAHGSLGGGPLHARVGHAPKPALLAPTCTSSSSGSWTSIPRGGADASVGSMVVSSVDGLKSHMDGAKGDTLLLLATTALNTPICKALSVSPILGFLSLGLAAGPKGFNLVKDVHTTEMIADLGVVLFLFEMGIHLSFNTLMKMKKDVFGLGGSQFLITALAVAAIAGYCGQSTAAMVVIGGSIALSSSAFVLQLLKDKDEMGSQFGKSSFGVLLLQDLAVVPLLVVTQILGGDNSAGVGAAIGQAVVQAALALTTIVLAGKYLLNPFFKLVAEADNQDAFVGAILATILGMSFLTEGLGLSNTLGAFLAGVLLSETKYRHQIETEISPFRGILVGLFFFTVGFEIDLNLIGSKPALIGGLVAGIISLKAVIATALSMAFGLGKATSQRVGLILSQGGEFAFVAFRLARSFGILDEDTTKLMLTCVSLTMAVTPFLEEFGAKMATKIEEDEAKKIA
jgi:CPA2 family monovalent cation:H+ antiporter-2